MENKYVVLYLNGQYVLTDVGMKPFDSVQEAMDRINYFNEHGGTMKDAKVYRIVEESTITQPAVELEDLKDRVRRLELDVAVLKCKDAVPNYPPYTYPYITTATSKPEESKSVLQE